MFIFKNTVKQANRAQGNLNMKEHSWVLCAVGSITY